MKSLRVPRTTLEVTCEPDAVVLHDGYAWIRIPRSAIEDLIALLRPPRRKRRTVFVYHRTTAVQKD